MKKTITILLGFLFVYNIVGFLFIHSILINLYKQVGMQKADNPSEEELIELIVLRKEDILSQRINYKRIHPGEFRLNGKMYDIVKEVDKDSLIYFCCINDKKEEELEDEFHKRVDENTEGKTQRANDNSILKSIVSEAVCSITFKQVNASMLIFGFNYIRTYISVLKEVLTPPPRLSLTNQFTNFSKYGLVLLTCIICFGVYRR